MGIEISKRTKVSSSAFVVLALILSGCSSSNSDTASDASDTALACANKKVTFVSTGKAGDKSVYDDMITNGLDASKTELGADTQYVEALDPAVFETTLTNAANAGANIIVTTFLDMSKPLATVAAKFPDIRFIQIYGLPNDPVIPNLRTVSFRYDEATYLSGILAGQVTSSNILGYEAGMFVPGINTDFNAFKSAALSVNSKIKVLPGDVGSFSDDGKAKEVVANLYAKGADIVQGDGPVVGHIQAAIDKNKYAIMGAPGLVSMAPANVMGVTFIYFGKAMFNSISDACGDGFTGGHIATGVLDGTTGFYVPQEFLDAGDPAVVAKVNAAMASVTAAENGIKDGSIIVPVNNDNP